ncbi:GNAT family N-acetyltransferase [Microlunatus parietis]|uniref:RimJ/RimL family protein N-acetyltransferase n=1 Tax=Microlunatus parietis TaxID=682979 RepID=A0A7Y9LFN3_9ACTN|nr:GNAT family N-acetyltransferase [Microlunatus parietis]NYE75028.1 RimJ/RimL family protein N-acetyltransferase [Microlunatus parietis]
MNESLNDLDLLRREIRLLWGVDDHGREAEPPRAAVPDPDPNRTEPPAELLLIKDRLDATTPTEITGCVSYLIDPARTVPVPPELALHRSGEPVPPDLAALRPDPEWEPDEWADLLAGRLGPWAFGITDGRIAAICHTPRDADGAAEAGVWTHPDHRGRGYAAAVTAAWAEVAAATRPLLYYSHLFDNAASRSVAGKIGARPLGRIWQLRNVGSSATTLATPDVH